LERFKEYPNQIGERLSFREFTDRDCDRRWTMMDLEAYINGAGLEVDPKGPQSG
jgi:hypothetical protein